MRERVELQAMGRDGRLREYAVALAVFVASLAILYAWHHRVTAPNFGLTGDEPHYIMIAHSLAVDGDLDLANNYAAGDADAWFPDLDADNHVNDYAGDGRQISVHTPGLPALLLPGYLLLENPARAARATMLLLSSLTLLQFYLLGCELTGNRWLSLAAWLVLATSVPMLYLAAQVYPDVPAALALLLGLRALRRLPAMRWTVLLALVICALPWLHVRYVPLSLILAGAGLAHLWREPGRRALWALLALCLAGAAGFVLFYISFYGNPLSNAQYGHLSSRAADWGRIPAIAIGLLFEREVGILPVAPFLLLGIAGGAAALVDRDRRALLPVLLVLAYGGVLTLALAAGVADWGWSLPWRFLLPVLPLMALLALYGAHRFPAWRLAALPLVAAGSLILVLSMRWPGGFYWRNAGVLAMPALDRGQGYLPSEEYARVREVPATAGVTTTHERPFGEPPGPVCAIAGQSEPGFLTWGIRKGMLPGEMQVTLYVRGETGASGASPGQVRVVNERTDQALAARDLTADDLVVAEWQPVTFTVASDRAMALMAVATYTGEGTLCLDRVVYEQTTFSQRDWGYLLAGIVTTALLGVGLAHGLAARRRDQ